MKDYSRGGVLRISLRGNQTRRLLAELFRVSCLTSDAIGLPEGVGGRVAGAVWGISAFNSVGPYGNECDALPAETSAAVTYPC